MLRSLLASLIAAPSADQCGHQGRGTGLRHDRVSEAEGAAVQVLGRLGSGRSGCVRSLV
jgi:hypothetical protein